MFYKPGEPHGLPHGPFKSLIVPRPIGWVSTVSSDGHVNLAPYSFFNGVSEPPAMVMFATNGVQPHGEPDKAKDTATNAEETGEFVCNMVGWDFKDAMSETSAPAKPEENEFNLAGLEMESSELVKPPRVKGAPAHLECKYYKSMELPPHPNGGRNAIIVGEVIGVHIDDAYLRDGVVDVEKIRPVARLGYMDYTSVTEIWTMKRPSQR